METRRIIVRKESALGGWTIYLDGQRVSTRGMPRYKVRSFVHGLEAGVLALDPSRWPVVRTEDDYGFRGALVEIGKKSVEIAFSLISILVMIFAIGHLFDLIRIGQVDWRTRDFAEHLGLQIAAVAYVALVVTGRLRLPWHHRDETA